MLGRTRTLWLVLWLAVLVGGPLLWIFGQPPAATCGAGHQVNPAFHPIYYGTAVIVYLALAYFALQERQIRSRLIGLALNLVVVFPALMAGSVLGFAILGPCAT